MRIQVGWRLLICHIVLSSVSREYFQFIMVKNISVRLHHCGEVGRAEIDFLVLLR